MTPLLKRAFEAQAASLRDFGYPDVTATDVANAHKKWVSGKEMEDIIEMFCERAFDEHPRLFGVRS